MRISCPYCGERGNGEFAYLGDGTLARPDTAPGAAFAGATLDAWMSYVYLRDNPPGLHAELSSACLAMAQPSTRRTANPAARARLERDYRAQLVMQRHRAELVSLGMS